MPTTRFAFLVTILGATLAVSCGQASRPGASSPSGSSKSTLPTCRWEPVKPDTEERCTLTTKGEQLKITQRDSMRAQDQHQITVTCVCSEP